MIVVHSFEGICLNISCSRFIRSAFPSQRGYYVSYLCSSLRMLMWCYCQCCYVCTICYRPFHANRVNYVVKWSVYGGIMLGSMCLPLFGSGFVHDAPCASTWYSFLAMFWKMSSVCLGLYLSFAGYFCWFYICDTFLVCISVSLSLWCLLCLLWFSIFVLCLVLDLNILNYSYHF